MMDDHADHGLGLALLQEEAATVKSPAAPSPAPPPPAAATPEAEVLFIDS